jgi:hypothetical protein
MQRSGGSIAQDVHREIMESGGDVNERVHREITELREISMRVRLQEDPRGRERALESF